MERKLVRSGRLIGGSWLVIHRGQKASQVGGQGLTIEAGSGLWHQAGAAGLVGRSRAVRCQRRVKLAAGGAAVGSRSQVR